MKIQSKALLALICAMTTVLLTVSARAENLTKCHLSFGMSGWSAFYQSATGTGTVTCDNGQSAKVSLRAKGGGITFGKTNISDGKGDFSDVTGIEQLYGKYASAQASAGAGKAAMGQVVTKGPVSLALSGKGHGIDIGIAFGEFVIEPIGKKKK